MKILWIDDDSATDEYGDLRRQLDRLAHERIENVDTGEESYLASSADAHHFFKEAAKGRYDLAIIDYKVPQTSGIEIGRQLLAMIGNVRILFLSSWVVQFNPHGKLDPRAVYAVAEKPTDGESIERWYEEVLLPKVTDLFRRQVHEFQPADPAFLQQLDIIPTDRASFDAMPFEQQMDRIDKALNAVEAYTEELFRQCGVDWVVFTWPELIVGYWGDLDSSVGEAKVLEFEEEYGRVAIRAGRALDVGEIGSTWSDCRQVPGAVSSDGDRIDSYPSLEVEVDGWRAFVNVDTGSVCSFLSLADMQESGLQDAIPARNRHNWQREVLQLGPQRREEYIRVAVLDRSVDVASTEGTVSIRLRARIIDGFRKTGLARTCPTGGCFMSVERSDGLFWCGHRKGLLGRDILRLNQILLVLDSMQRRTYVVLEDQTSGPGLGEVPSSPLVSSAFVEYSID